jgi:hypothetical protein
MLAPQLTWQYTPDSVDLRVVLVDLGNDQEDRRESKRDRKAHNQRVRRDIELLQALQASGILDEFAWELVKLWDIWLDCEIPIGAVRKRTHAGEREGESGQHREYGGMLEKCV